MKQKVKTTTQQEVNAWHEFAKALAQQIKQEMLAEKQKGVENNEFETQEV